MLVLWRGARTSTFEGFLEPVSSGWMCWTTWGDVSSVGRCNQVVTGLGREHELIICLRSPLSTARHPINQFSRFPPLLPIRLRTLKLIKLHPLQHPTIDSNPRLRVAHHRIVGHTPTMFASIEAQPLFAPDICFHSIIAFDLNFLWLVVGPESAVAPAYGAEAFESGFEEWWEGDADCFAVAGYAL